MSACPAPRNYGGGRDGTGGTTKSGEDVTCEHIRNLIRLAKLAELLECWRVRCMTCCACSLAHLVEESHEVDSNRCYEMMEMSVCRASVTSATNVHRVHSGCYGPSTKVPSTWSEEPVRDLMLLANNLTAGSNIHFSPGLLGKLYFLLPTISPTAPEP